MCVRKLNLNAHPTRGTPSVTIRFDQTYTFYPGTLLPTTRYLSRLYGLVDMVNLKRRVCVCVDAHKFNQ